MNLKTLLSVYAVFAAVSGVAFLVVPSAVMSLYGVPTLDLVESSLARNIGTMMLGLGVMCWTARTAEASKARDALILGLTIINGLWTLLAVRTGLSVGGWLIWAEVPFFALLTVLFILARRETTSTPTSDAGTSTTM